jgi:hypothetical protein
LLFAVSVGFTGRCVAGADFTIGRVASTWSFRRAFLCHDERTTVLFTLIHISCDTFECVWDARVLVVLKYFSAANETVDQGEKKSQAAGPQQVI